MPSRHTRAISAPNTVITAPPASTPRTCVRPDGFLPASLAALSRLSLGDLAIAPTLAQVDLCELVHEDHAELDQSAELGADAAGAARAERGHLLGEVLHPDAQDPGGDQLGGRVTGFVDVALQDLREQRRRVLPEVEAGVVLDQLVTGHRERMPDAVAEPEPVEHALHTGVGGVGVIHEEVEDALLDRQPPAERIALQVAHRAGLARRVGGEAVHVGHLDREVELQELRSVAARLGTAREVGLPEGDVAEHLLGEANAGHEAAASAARRSGSMIWSAKRSARAAIVKLGFGPVGPGITDPSAMCRPG